MSPVLLSFRPNRVSFSLRDLIFCSSSLFFFSVITRSHFFHLLPMLSQHNVVHSGFLRMSSVGKVRITTVFFTEWIKRTVCSHVCVHSTSATLQTADKKPAWPSQCGGTAWWPVRASGPCTPVLSGGSAAAVPVRQSPRKTIIHIGFLFVTRNTIQVRDAPHCSRMDGALVLSGHWSCEHFLPDPRISAQVVHSQWSWWSEPHQWRSTPGGWFPNTTSAAAQSLRSVKPTNRMSQTDREGIARLREMRRYHTGTYHKRSNGHFSFADFLISCLEQVQVTVKTSYRVETS